MERERGERGDRGEMQRKKENEKRNNFKSQVLLAMRMNRHQKSRIKSNFNRIQRNLKTRYYSLSSLPIPSILPSLLSPFSLLSLLSLSSPSPSHHYIQKRQAAIYECPATTLYRNFFKKQIDAQGLLLIVDNWLYVQQVLERKR